ncbi:MAG: hypothetical protein A3F04_02270 [Candidatus Chisholmbacteria bacterium RIFCSPHIGHO2_12_FULL_49_9]|uniref:DUF2304 domain-containing protein n=1 Tax=Candidatus Chisholmbacteria bacterium RIFCSPHIGHO2_01_FULL_52_32 TaxID=1797591 RepID=A0A1G1VT10_9BACT|nr:MAG: hypothetical protein A3F04_02270 [Candidatus Chisholmbacteria bacterium RIFCSPHIGHO2_12_FULL_49_9]OGY18529.1 MAG: hypothetical protein A2786_03460 [Candidatus Chisholmbacteria bacterium RIFCSPHIGHO2_01_FULL_52_32]OGY20100.1 MAG: hypothetical protein A2900_03285 [Candidatus Chisholmbacteria bacterium RIFCSPLOWO2_01_FULL_50_28]
MQILLIPVQVFLLIFILFAFSRVWLRFRERTINIGTFLFWSLIWGLAALGSLNPQFTTSIARVLGIGRGADVVIYASLVLLFYLVYRTNVILENVRHQITELVRKIALEGEKRSKKKK